MAKDLSHLQLMKLFTLVQFKMLLSFQAAYNKTFVTHIIV